MNADWLRESRAGVRSFHRLCAHKDDLPVDVPAADRWGSSQPLPAAARAALTTVCRVSDSLGRLTVALKTGRERFRFRGADRDEDLLRFWRWTSSDLVGNAMRGLLAEYIVGMAVGAVSTTTRQEWDAADLVTEDGVRIEVKSAAYLQSWAQEALSRISFGIQPTLGWDASTDIRSAEPRRQADVYVFCLLHQTDKAAVDPMDLDQWTFYVLPTRRLDDELGAQKRVALSRLLGLGPATVSFAALAEAVVDAARKLVEPEPS